MIATIDMSNRQRQTAPVGRPPSANSGVGSYVGIFVLATLAYLAFLFAPPYMERSKLSTKISIAARQSRIRGNNEFLLAEVQKEIQILGITVLPEDLKVERDDGGRWAKVSVRYKREVRLPGGKMIPLKFDLQVTDP